MPSRKGQATVKAETAGLVMFGLAEPVQIMSGFLPSPATAEISGGDPDRFARFRRDEVIGGTIAVGISIAVALLTYETIGKEAWLVPAGSLIIVGLFFYEFEHAMRTGREKGNTTPGLGA